MDKPVKKKVYLSTFGPSVSRWELLAEVGTTAPAQCGTERYTENKIPLTV